MHSIRAAGSLIRLLRVSLALLSLMISSAQAITPTHTAQPVCTAPSCAIGEGEVYHCPEVCPGGCGTICATPTPTHTSTPMPVCTPPLCANGEFLHCQEVCPGGCGLICVTPIPTPTSTPSPSPTSVVNDPPSVDQVTSPTNRCTQTVRGSGRALFCGRSGSIYVLDADEIDNMVSCDFGRYEVTVRLETNRTNRFSVCETGGTTGGNGGCREVEIDQVFLGDCDDDSNVTVDEVVSLVAIALGVRPVSECELGDGDGDQAVMVDEITTAVTNALVGCMPATRYADLVPLSAREKCSRGCGPYSIDLCVANQGDVAVHGFAVSLSNRDGAMQSEIFDNDLGAAEDVCLEVPYRVPPSSEGIVTFTVDSGGTVQETNEDNNTLQFPQPNPTGCDIICTPTPEPAV